MRIAYISLHWPRTFSSGVGKKIHRQISAWQKAGHEVKFFMHTHEYQPVKDLIPGEVLFYRSQAGMCGMLLTEFERAAAARRLLEAVEGFRPDLIYLRYGMYVFPIHRLTKVAPTVEEINTNDLIQHEGLGFVFSLYNRLTRGTLLRRVDGLVCVSRELAATPAFSVYRKPTKVISNGIALEAIKPSPPPKNKIPRLIFIATPGYYWHGIDKLASLARTFPDLVIDVVGYDHIPGCGALPDNLKLHGYLTSYEYENVIKNADVAIGTLALYRKGMQEASPLKTRECLAYGLPVILPYVDTDLDDLDCEFLLRIPNREDNIATHGAAIRDFAYKMRGRRVDRKLIAARIDLRQKEAERLTFFEQVVVLGARYGESKGSDVRQYNN